MMVEILGRERREPITLTADERDMLLCALVARGNGRLWAAGHGCAIFHLSSASIMLIAEKDSEPSPFMIRGDEDEQRSFTEADVLHQLSNDSYFAKSMADGVIYDLLYATERGGAS
jgi:hypothetical protein